MNESIAIIGMSGLFPGAKNYHQFWDNLISGTVSTINHKGDETSANYINAGGHIFDAEGFDPHKYNISEKEAELMDPQLRKFIELVDNALNDADYPQGKNLSNVSVIASQGSNYTYHNELTKLIARGEIPHPNQLLENINKGADFMASRIAYLFNFHGPCFNLQSACSSSLMTIVEAYWMLQTGRSNAVVCGGVHISYPLQSGYYYQAGSIYSASGLCRPFDHQADGTLPSDGGGVVILKRLKDAIRDNDNIHAVIAGALSNNDGSQKMSYAAPSITGQYELLNNIYQHTQINPRTLQFIECHATGTIVGDPMEVKGIQKLMHHYSSDNDQRRVMLGSVKGNIGHLFWASGIASLIKSVLSVKYGVYPATANIEYVNPLLELQQDRALCICSSNTALEDSDKIYAGVSSMGVGGTNAHLIIQRYHNNWQQAPLSEPREYIKKTRYSLLPQIQNNSSALEPAHTQQSPDQPVDNVLQHIIAIWCEALGEKNINTDSDYFDLYGDSVTAIEIISMIKNKLHVEIYSDTIYHYPTPAKLTDYIISKKNELITKPIVPPLLPSDIKNAFSFNVYQTRFYLLEKIQRGQFSHYNVPLCLKITKDFPRSAFTQSLNNILSILPQFNQQCSWTMQGLILGPPREQLVSEEQIIISSYQESSKIFHQLFGQRFSLENGVICKLHYINHNHENYLIINFPHLLIDGSGLHNLLQALEENLREPSNSTTRLIPLIRQKNWTAQHRDYWKKKLTGKKASRLPDSFSVADNTPVIAGVICQHFDFPLVERVQQIARKYKTSPFVIWYAIFNRYLSDLLELDYVYTGTTIANRCQDESSTIGCYINNVPIIVNCRNGNMVNILNETAKVLREGIKYASIPLDIIIRDIKGSGEAIYDILFMYQNQNKGYQLTVGNQVFKEATIRYQPIYSNLCFNLIPADTGMDIDVTFNHSRYSYDDIQIFSDNYHLALNQYLIELEK